MGQYDAIKATASGGYSPLIENKFSFQQNYSTSPSMTLSRLPGETEAAYMLRLTAIRQRTQELAQQKQDALLQFQKDKLAYERNLDEKERENNDEYFSKRYTLNFNPNDMKSIDNALSLGSMGKIFYTYNKMGKGNMVSILNRDIQEARLAKERLEKGEKNSARYETQQNKQNYGGFEYQPQGQRDILS